MGLASVGAPPCAAGPRLLLVTKVDFQPLTCTYCRPKTYLKSETMNTAK
jgi:hypothetical protein